MSDDTIVLRTCAADMRSYGGFLWARAGHVVAPAWSDSPEDYDNGLFGLELGRGYAGMLRWEPSARWLLVNVDERCIVRLDGKVKFREGNVIFCGERDAAIAQLCDLRGSNHKTVVHEVLDAVKRARPRLYPITWWDSLTQRWKTTEL